MTAHKAQGESTLPERLPPSGFLHGPRRRPEARQKAAGSARLRSTRRSASRAHAGVSLASSPRPHSRLPRWEGQPPAQPVSHVCPFDTDASMFSNDTRLPLRSEPGPRGSDAVFSFMPFTSGCQRTSFPHLHKHIPRSLFLKWNF